MRDHKPCLDGWLVKALGDDMSETRRYTVRYYAKERGDIQRFGIDPLIVWAGSAESPADALAAADRESPALTCPDTGADVPTRRTVALEVP